MSPETAVDIAIFNNKDSTKSKILYEAKKIYSVNAMNIHLGKDVWIDDEYKL
jgi:hypothetical protein